MASPLEDLDELVLRCRDLRARVYIREAVSSYRAGAFRSAIVACWIAVCFDIIEKLRELSLAGDKEAEKNVHDLDVIHRTGDVTRALKFERELLSLARDKFELISPLEHIDLERLQADRNRCAHPSLTADDQAYSPSAELARLHIHSAVTHLLQHPPVQGKYALDRLMEDVESEYFPTSETDARIAFEAGPLRRPRESLVRNFVIVIVKALLAGKLEYKRAARLRAALVAVRALHPIPSTAVLSERLSQFFRLVPDGTIGVAVRFVLQVKDSWQYLDVDVRQRLQTYIRAIPAETFDDLELILPFQPLRAAALERIARATRSEIAGALFLEMPEEVVNRFVSIYLGSNTFDEANACAKQMMIHSGDFSPDHVRRILANAAKNPDIRGSFQLSSLISNLRARKKLPSEEFDLLLRANDLEEYVADSRDA